MPFPNQKIINAFLKEYFKYRDREVWSGTARATFDSVVSLLSSKKSDKETRDAQILEFEKEFLAADTYDKWILVIQSLGAKARTAQKEQSESYLSLHKASEFAFTLHAVRTYIIHCLLNSEFKNKYQAEINKKRDQVNTLTQMIDQKFNANNSIAELKIQRLHLRKQLIDMHDMETIKFIATETELFTNELLSKEAIAQLPLRQRINPDVPIYYQLFYFNIYYKEVIKKIPLRRNDFEACLKAEAGKELNFEEEFEEELDALIETDREFDDSQKDDLALALINSNQAASNSNGSSNSNNASSPQIISNAASPITLFGKASAQTSPEVNTELKAATPEPTGTQTNASPTPHKTGAAKKKR